MLNVVALMGRLVADPELRKTPTGVSTTTFTIACERNYAKPGEQRQTDFIDIVAWRGTAEFASKYFRKGHLMAVNGSIQTRTYEDKEGKKRKVFEVVADNLHFADSKGAQPQERPQEYDEKKLDADPGEPDDFAVIDDSEDLPWF